MSHSDSELNKSRDAYKKKLNVAFKAKHLMNRLSRTQYAQLKKSLRSLKHSKVLIAAAQNNVEVVTNQLNSGANPNCADMHGRSPLHLAASKGYIDIVKLLLEKGADPNIQDKLKNTPLHLAACSHNFQIISLLLHAGADVRNLDLYGKNPLHLAQSKLQLLQRSWREGSIEMAHVRTQLQLVNIKLDLSYFFFT